MNETFTAKVSEVIDASPQMVWEAITDPKLVKEWLFGTEMEVTSWEAGEQIYYRGEWQGKPYEDKGEILEIVPDEKLVSSYWSSFSGLPDSPENYQKVTYQLIPEGNITRITIIQEGVKKEEQAKHSEGNWKRALGAMKKLLENIE